MCATVSVCVCKFVSVSSKEWSLCGPVKKSSLLQACGQCHEVAHFALMLLVVLIDARQTVHFEVSSLHCDSTPSVLQRSKSCTVSRCPQCVCSSRSHSSCLRQRLVCFCSRASVHVQGQKYEVHWCCAMRQPTVLSACSTAVFERSSFLFPTPFGGVFPLRTEMSPPCSSSLGALPRQGCLPHQNSPSSRARTH